MQVKQNMIIKRIVDVCMTVLLLCLMAYQVTGEALHEWIGIGMTVLVIIHQILNRKWYGAIFKEKYNPYRIVTTVVNIALLLAFALTAFCGMSMSGHAVPFLYEDEKIYVATVPDKVHGAGVLAYQDLMEQAAERAGGDFYILPSSLHEVLIVPDNGEMGLKDLEAMVKEVNATQVAPADKLTDSVYHYDSQAKIFELGEKFVAL